MKNQKIKVWIICLVLVVLVGGVIGQAPNEWDDVKWSDSDVFNGNLINSLFIPKLKKYAQNLENPNAIEHLVKGFKEILSSSSINKEKMGYLWDSISVQLGEEALIKILNGINGNNLNKLSGLLDSSRLGVELTRYEELLKVALTGKKINGEKLTNVVSSGELNEAAQTIINEWAKEDDNALGKKWYKLLYQEQELAKSENRPKDYEMINKMLEKMTPEQRKSVIEYVLKSENPKLEIINIPEEIYENPSAFKISKNNILEITKDDKTYQIPLSNIPSSVTEIGILDKTKPNNLNYDGVYYKGADGKPLAVINKGYIVEQDGKLILASTGLYENPTLTLGTDGIIYYDPITGFQLWGKDTAVEIDKKTFLPDPNFKFKGGVHYTAFEVPKKGVFKKTGPGRLWIKDSVNGINVNAFGNLEQGVTIDFTGTKSDADISISPSLEKDGSLSIKLFKSSNPLLYKKQDGDTLVISSDTFVVLNKDGDTITDPIYAATNNNPTVDDGQHVNRQGHYEWQRVRGGIFPRKLIPKYKRVFVSGDVGGESAVTNSEGGEGHWVRQRVRGRFFPRRFIPKYRMVWVSNQGSGGGGVEGGEVARGGGRVGREIRRSFAQVAAPTGTASTGTTPSPKPTTLPTTPAPTKTPSPSPQTPAPRTPSPSPDEVTPDYEI